MAGFEMILRDQYFLTCDKSLQIFLKEKGKLSLKEMTKVSNDYFEAHGYPAENHERKINGVNNKAYTHKSNNGQTSAGPITASIQCGNCGMRNHTTNEYRKPRAAHGNTDHIVCFQCNQVGHKRNTCPMNRPNRSAGPQRVAAMQHFTVHTPTHNYSGPHHCNESRSDGEIKLACGYMMPVVAGALSPGDALAIITQYVACMERQFSACQTPRSMYLSIFNSF